MIGVCLLTFVVVLLLLSQFQALAVEAIHETDSNGNSIFASVHSLSLAYISLADNTRSAWPNVTDRNFNTIVEDMAEHVPFDALIFAPIVSRRVKPAFEAYAVSQQDLLWTQGIHKDSLTEGKESGDTRTEKQTDVKLDPIREQIHLYNSSSHSDEDRDFYVPIWQLGPNPQNSSIVLMDLHSHPVLQRAIDWSLGQFGDALSDTFNADFILQSLQPPQPGVTISAPDDVDSENTDNQNQPPINKANEGLYSLYVQPILSNFTLESEVAGFAMAVISWEAFFSGREKLWLPKVSRFSYCLW
jgi:CHASE domain